ncbi:MAG: lytic transglycosylase [Trichlorobacter sp.]|nr:lytic transglycosylase [Trichlorobacter sp.]
MKKTSITINIHHLVAVLLLLLLPIFFVACSNALWHSSPEISASDIPEDSLEFELRTVMEKGISLEERKQQLPVIEEAFARLTTAERARNLAALCYLKTLGTRLAPFDLAEIALAETGGHALSSDATSVKGAIGVWQLMPNQARIHGYTASEMRNDEKCAEAAVRTLLEKLVIARGQLDLAKKYYCGVGPQADAYLRKVQNIRRQLHVSLANSKPAKPLQIADASLD